MAWPHPLPLHHDALPGCGCHITTTCALIVTLMSPRHASLVTTPHMTLPPRYCNMGLHYTHITMTGTTLGTCPHLTPNSLLTTCHTNPGKHEHPHPTVQATPHHRVLPTPTPQHAISANTLLPHSAPHRTVSPAVPSHTAHPPTNSPPGAAIPKLQPPITPTLLPQRWATRTHPHARSVPRCHHMPAHPTNTCRASLATSRTPTLLGYKGNVDRGATQGRTG